MLFHSFAYFLLFFTVFSVYWAVHHHGAHMWWLLAASCIFYATWSPWFLLLIGFTATIDYVLAIKIENASTPRAKGWILAASIVMSLGVLSLFKYTGFLLEVFTAGVHWAGWGRGFTLADLFEPAQWYDRNLRAGLAMLGVHWDPQPAAHMLVPKDRKDLDAGLQFLLPLGISFYTFETISYVVDVYKGRMKAVRNVRDYALFIMFFPHLISGPIVRPREFLPQTRQAKHFDWDRLQLGAQLFLMGLFKKAVLADHAATIVEPVFREPQKYSSGAIWLAMFLYSVQVYCDFSGYSDMAIGSAHALGFKLPLNFNMPLLAASIGEFWRKWHITLSSWLRDYVYISLGGSRWSYRATHIVMFLGLSAVAVLGTPYLVGPVVQGHISDNPATVTAVIRGVQIAGVLASSLLLLSATGVYCNLILTMVLCGLWHGAGYQYVVFGLYMGLLLSIERLFNTGALPGGGLAKKPWLTPAKILGTYLLFCLGLITFRSHTFEGAMLMYHRLFVWTGTPLSQWPGVSADKVGLSPILVNTGIAVLVTTLIGHLVGRFVDLPRFERRAPALATGLAMGVVFLAIQVLMAEGSAFIYFQF